MPDILTPAALLALAIWAAFMLWAFMSWRPGYRCADRRKHQTSEHPLRRKTDWPEVDRA